MRARSASTLASPGSDFAPDVECRSRYRDVDIGFTANTVYPAATSAPMNKPRSVSVADHDIGRIVDMAGDPLMEPGHPLDALRQPATTEAVTGVVFDEHVVMVLGPVQTDEHLAPSAPPRCLVVDVEPEATSSSLMVQCSKHVIPPAITANLTNRPAHDLDLELNAQRRKVLTGQRLGTILPATSGPDDRPPLALPRCARTAQHVGRDYTAIGGEVPGARARVHVGCASSC